MNTMELLKYWESKIEDGKFRFGFMDKNQDTKIKELQQAGITIHHMAKDIGQVTKGKKELKQVVFLSALFLTLYDLKGDKKIGILTQCNGKLLPIIAKINPQMTVRDFMNYIIDCFKKTYKYSNLNLDSILKYIASDGNLDSIKKHMLVLNIEDKKEKPDFVEEQININEKEITMDFNPNSFSLSQIKRYLNYYKNMLAQIISNQDTRIEDLNVFDEDESQKYLELWQGKTVPMEESINLAEMFYGTVKENRNESAVIYQNQIITYQQLYNAVQNVVLQLYDNNIKVNDRIAVLCTQTPQTIAAIMAIIQIGAVYIPIDFSCPLDKKNYILDKSGANLLIKTEDNGIRDELVPSLKIDFDTEKKRELQVTSKDDNDLYLIFTSGTTGKPKGVLINIKQFYNLHLWYKNTFSITNSSRIILLTNFGFDASIKNILTPLLSGATLVLAVNELFNTPEIVSIIERNSVTHVNCVPALFRSLLDTVKEESFKPLSSLEHVILGGEKLNINQFRQWIDSKDFHSKLSNVYGPTEGTDLTTCHILTDNEIKEEKEIPIGKPIYNRYVYVLNKNNKICPPKEKGILYIAGIGVVKNYMDQSIPDNKFIPDPFHSGGLMYNTGDIAEWSEDGELLYCGRQDNQIKLNGQRIELEEIESIINEFKNIKACAAVVQSENKQKNQLLVFYQLEDECTNFNENELKDYCRKWFSAATMPSQFIPIDHFPLSANGKVDRSLLKINKIDIKDEDTKPLDEIEEKLLKAWKITLNINCCPLNKPFFELGGNSLLLYKLKNEIEKQMDIDISILDFFEYPTIKELAAYLKN